MEADKKPDEAAADKTPSGEQTAPADALTKSNDELGESAASETPVNADGTSTPDGKPPKKLNPAKAFLKKVNVYLLLFLLLCAVGAVVAVVGYLNGKKTPPPATVNTQPLTQETLKQLANSDATVGDSGQTLTVQGNEVVSGQVLIRSNLNVAGTIQLGSTLSVPGLTVSGQSNLAATQVNSLQVATGSTFQGQVTIQNGVNVAGASSFSGPITAGQITVTKLILSGNAQLQVANHVAFTGPSPSRSINPGVLGAGGSASVNGSDSTGTVNVNSGNNPSTGCFVTMNFAQKFTNTPHVVVTPIGSGAGQGQWYVNRSTSSFSICVNSPFPANQAFAYDYFITD